MQYAAVRGCLDFVENLGNTLVQVKYKKSVHVFKITISQYREGKNVLQL